LADLRHVLVVGSGPVKSDAGVHGSDLGYIWDYGNVELTVDFSAEHDGWVPIVNPPIWKDTGKQGWVKKSRLASDMAGETKLLVTVFEDGRAPTVRLVG
jgi:hypothetical protein